MIFKETWLIEGFKKVPWYSQFLSFYLPFRLSFWRPCQFPYKQTIRWESKCRFHLTISMQSTNILDRFQKFISCYLLFIGRTRTATLTEAILCRLSWPKSILCLSRLVCFLLIWLCHLISNSIGIERSGKSLFLHSPFRLLVAKR